MPDQKAELSKAAGMLDESTPHHVWFGYLLSFLAAFVGGLVGAYAGWFVLPAQRKSYIGGGGLEINGTYMKEGLYPILGASIGFVVFFLICWCASGPAEYHYSQLSTALKPPELERLKAVGLSSFDLYVTVHRVKNLYSLAVLGLLGGATHSFIEVVVGRLVDDGKYFSAQKNPPKRTCVTLANTFEECFRFVVAPTDDTIRFILYNQEVAEDVMVGITDVSITDVIIGEGFPQKRAFTMTRTHTTAGIHEVKQKDPTHIAGTLVVSFTPGANFPAGQQWLKEKNRLAFDRMRSFRDNLVSRTENSAGQYGTWLMSSKA